MIKRSGPNALRGVQGAVPIDGAMERAAVTADRHARFRVAIEPLLKVAFRVLRRLGVRDAEIDDALQAVLIAADRKFDDLLDRGELKAYVCAACVNVARDAGRRRERQKARCSWLEDLEDDPLAADVDPEGALELKQALVMIQWALDGMIAERREVFVLYELEELTAREIAEHLGIPPGTVASRLRKAREDLRVALDSVTEDSLFPQGLR